MNQKHLLVALLVVLTVTLMVTVVDAQGPQPRAPRALPGTGFTYQGQLKSGGALVNANCDFEFGLWDGSSAGPQYGSTQTVSSLSVTNGLFTTMLDFGVATPNNVFTGTARYLQSRVRCPSGVGITTTLSPRQALTPAPMAFALPGMYTQQNATSPNVIGGYSGNVITPTLIGATIGGGGSSGSPNRAWANYATVGGGYDNTASNSSSTVGGGDNNTASGSRSTIAGGADNTASDYYATVGGGITNNASGYAATIGGGESNTASNRYATVGGGLSNSATMTYSTVSGGKNNNATGITSTVSGGYSNTASGSRAFVGGGEFNTASGNTASIGGGFQNIASYNFATVSGGYINEASGYVATVPGGSGNHAAGDYSFAAGRAAKAIYEGSFVWADCDPCLGFSQSFTSTAANQFLIRANGGMGVNTNSPALNTLTVGGNGLKVGGIGSTFLNIQSGEATLGSGSGSVTNVYTVTFPSTFTTTPKVLATVRNDYPTWDVGDTFAVTVRRISTTQFVVNIFRVDSTGGWSQSLKLDWYAWE